jgi:hypothetical protein
LSLPARKQALYFVLMRSNKVFCALTNFALSVAAWFRYQEDPDCRLGCSPRKWHTENVLQWSSRIVLFSSQVWQDTLTLLC